MDKHIDATAKLVESLSRFRITLLIALAGCLLLLISFVEIKNLTIATTRETNFISLVPGLACIAFAVWVRCDRRFPQTAGTGMTRRRQG